MNPFGHFYRVTLIELDRQRAQLGNAYPEMDTYRRELQNALHAHAQGASA